MGVDPSTERGETATISVTRRDDAWYLTDTPGDRDVQCIVMGGGEPSTEDSPCELEGTVSKYVRSTGDAPDFLFFELGSAVIRDTEQGNGSARTTDTGSSDPDSRTETRCPERRLTDLSGSGDYVTVEAVVDSIEWVRKGEPNVPDIVGELRDERSVDVLPFVVSDDVRHPYLEEGTVFEFTGVRDHYYERRDRIQVLITELTEFEEIGTATPRTSPKSTESKSSTSSKGNELDSIADSTIGERVFTESQEERSAIVGRAKRRARKQGRDPAIDPKLR